MKRAIQLRFFVAAIGLLGATCTRFAAPDLPPLPVVVDPAQISFAEQVSPVLERRCAVCHGCYDAPCQLLLTSAAGLDRGANKRPVYASAQLLAGQPTRLFVDEKSTEGWRQRDFFSVLEGSAPGAADSLLLRLLSLGRAHSFAAGERLRDSFPLDISRSLSCPTLDEFNEYAAKQPMGGMPYGTAPLADADLALLASWATRGEPPLVAPLTLPAAATSQVADWETFLNGESLKQRITARYLFEHWFLAHLYFGDLPAGPFLRIVRSTTPPGVAIDEIATRRPYDDPGDSRFWYRLQPIESAIVHKTHIVYRLSSAKRRRLSELFLDSEWEPSRLPGYGNRASPAGAPQALEMAPPTRTSSKNASWTPYPRLRFAFRRGSPRRRPPHR